MESRIELAFVWIYRLFRACEVQTLTYGAAGCYAMPTPEACAHTARARADFLTAYGTSPPGELEFNAFDRLMDRRDPSFRS